MLASHSVAPVAAAAPVQQSPVATATAEEFGIGRSITLSGHAKSQSTRSVGEQARVPPNDHRWGYAGALHHAKSLGLGSSISALSQAAFASATGQLGTGSASARASSAHPADLSSSSSSASSAAASAAPGPDSSRREALGAAGPGSPQRKPRPWSSIDTVLEPAASFAPARSYAHATLSRLHGVKVRDLFLSHAHRSGTRREDVARSAAHSAYTPAGSRMPERPAVGPAGAEGPVAEGTAADLSAPVTVRDPRQKDKFEQVARYLSDVWVENRHKEARAERLRQHTKQLVEDWSAQLARFDEEVTRRQESFMHSKQRLPWRGPYLALPRDTSLTPNTSSLPPASASGFSATASVPASAPAAPGGRWVPPSHLPAWRGELGPAVEAYHAMDAWSLDLDAEAERARAAARRKQPAPEPEPRRWDLVQENAAARDRLFAATATVGNSRNVSYAPPSRDGVRRTGTGGPAAPAAALNMRGSPLAPAPAPAFASALPAVHGKSPDFDPESSQVSFSPYRALSADANLSRTLPPPNFAGFDRTTGGVVTGRFAPASAIRTAASAASRGLLPDGSPLPPPASARSSTASERANTASSAAAAAAVGIGAGKPLAGSAALWGSTSHMFGSAAAAGAVTSGTADAAAGGTATAPAASADEDGQSLQSEAESEAEFTILSAAQIARNAADAAEAAARAAAEANAAAAEADGDGEEDGAAAADTVAVDPSFVASRIAEPPAGTSRTFVSFSGTGALFPRGDAAAADGGFDPTGPLLTPVFEPNSHLPVLLPPRAPLAAPPASAPAGSATRATTPGRKSATGSLPASRAPSKPGTASGSKPGTAGSTRGAAASAAAGAAAASAAMAFPQPKLAPLAPWQQPTYELPATRQSALDQAAVAAVRAATHVVRRQELAECDTIKTTLAQNGVNVTRGALERALATPAVFLGDQERQVYAVTQHQLAPNPFQADDASKKKKKKKKVKSDKGKGR